jgi:hypothetical protein
MNVVFGHDHADQSSVGAFVPNVWVLSGGRFVTGTAGCVGRHHQPVGLWADKAGRVWFYLHYHSILTTSIHAFDRNCDIPLTRTWSSYSTEHND